MTRSRRPGRRDTSAPPEADEPAVRLSRKLPGLRGVRTHRRDGVDVLFVTALHDVELAVRFRLADEPRAVVCDLTDLDGGDDALVPGRLSGVAELARAWPGVPVAVVSDAAMRTRLTGVPACAGLLLCASLSEAWRRLAAHSTPAVATRVLPPHPTAARAGRDFLTETLLEWRLPRAVSAGSLVMSELVTNAMVHARSDIEVSLARHTTLVRIAVRDRDPGLPLPRPAGAESLSGRGLVLVAGYSRAWGVLPCSPRGKVVWAVVES